MQEFLIQNLKSKIASVRKKRGPKYRHEGTTRNGFEEIDQTIELNVEKCPVCNSTVERVESAPVQRTQIAEPFNFRF
jgi:G:T/U-mismatch repair DNA glycosylase